MGSTNDMGERLRRIRKSRGKSQDVIAGRAGISKSYLSLLENGQRPLDGMSLIRRLADALEIPPSELSLLPVPAPANGKTDSTIEAIRLVLDAIDVKHPGGIALPYAALADRVAAIHRQLRACEFKAVADDLPQLIRDLHTTLDTGADRRGLLALAVHLHVHVTRMWLNAAWAPVDLRRRVVFVARNLAGEHGDPAVRSVAAFGTTDVLAGGGAFDLAQHELDSLGEPATTADTAGLLAALRSVHALLAVVHGHPADADAPMAEAVDIAGRFGEQPHDPLGFAFGPTNVGFRRVRLAMEAAEPDRAVQIAESLNPDENPFPQSRAYHWVGYGRSLARLRGRRDDAVRALRRAEFIYPHYVQRDSMVRDVLGALVTRGPASEELLSMARRAGLEVPL